MRSKVTARAIRIPDGHSAHDSYGKGNSRGRHGSCKTIQNLIHYSVIPDIYTRS